MDSNDKSDSHTALTQADTMAEAEAPAPATDPAKEDGSKPHDADTGLEKDLDSVSLGDTSAVRDESPISEDHALLSDDDDDLIIETPQEREYPQSLFFFYLLFLSLLYNCIPGNCDRNCRAFFVGQKNKTRTDY